MYVRMSEEIVVRFCKKKNGFTGFFSITDKKVPFCTSLKQGCLNYNEKSIYTSCNNYINVQM